ncbi:MAG: UTP--glucose-1-phosphate uridylyltransferase [Planctomycetes bacterium]|nr:UTP--glucose-1-phosphate uridylyltransferase [Planctomycetota bacterium]
MIKFNSETDRILAAKIQEEGQGHVFDHWDSLSPADQKQLLNQLRSLDLPRIKELIQTYRRGEQKKLQARVLQPAQWIPAASWLSDPDRLQEMKKTGEKALREGAVAVLMAAGGICQPGSNHLRGNFPIGPVSGKSLFQLHAEKVWAVSRRYRATIPFLVVTSPETHEKTQQAFQEHEFFCLARQDVKFLIQDSLPMLDRRGRFILCESGRVAMHPSGHGAALLLLLKDEVFQNLELRGIRHLFYFQSDNPMVRIADPVMLGYHLAGDHEITSKAVLKTDPDEKIGVFCLCNGSPAVVEYSELSPADRELRREDGTLAFSAGNVAIHVFSMDFLRRLRREKRTLPCHLVEKVCPHLDRHGQKVVPKKANSIHFENFIFDAIALAEKTAILETLRPEEFSPIKNAEGANSPATAKEDLCRLYARWLKEAGAQFAPGLNGGEGENAACFPVEISPRFALDGEELREKVHLPLVVQPGLYLDQPGTGQ